MPTHAGPNTKGQENLVFGYDLGDVSNSYKGEPTTNYGPASFGDWGTESTAERIATGNTYKGQPTYNCRTVVGESWRGIEKTISGLRTAAGSSGTVTMSCMVRNNNSSSYPMYAYIGHDFSSTRTIAANSDWQKVQWTVNQSSMNNDYVEFRPYTNNANIHLEMTMPMVEVNKGHATQFTGGTRSVSGSLIDLTGNSTLDLTNVSFDSNAQMTFDGSNDYIAASIPTGSAFTIETLINQDSTPVDDYQSFVWASSGNGYDRIGIDSDRALRWRVRDSAGSYSDKISSTSYVTFNQNCHIMIVLEGGTIRYYKNGTLTDTFTGLTFYSDFGGSIRIGHNYTSNQYFNGDIPMIKIYNRALTASEIKSNYNAIKGRFNI